MKKILLSCLLFFGLTLFGQELESVGIRVDVPEISQPHASPNSRSVTCGIDTVMYTMAKSTGAQGISINNASSAYAFCQYFDCPQEITVHGAQFVAYKQNSTGGDTIDVIVALYKASPDSLPWGAPLATDTVKVDINIWSLNLDLLKKKATFWTPVTLNEPYIIAVINNSPNSITMWSSDYQAGDGQGEHLGSARIGFNWTRSYDLNVGGSPFDADMLIYPTVSYDLDADLYLDPNCVTGVNNITTTNLSSPVLFNRFYSQEAFNSAAGNQCTWDWGDATPNSNGINPGHTYGGGTYDVTLTDTLVGWFTTCFDAETLSTCAPPVADYDIQDTICVYDCLTITNNSLRGATWAWTFDGGTPGGWAAVIPDSVCWDTPGTYDIELIVSNPAGSDTLTKTIYIDNCGVGINENENKELLIYPNPASSQITITSADPVKAAQVYDMSGKLILNTIFNINGFSVIDVQSLPNGIYAVQIQFDDDTFTNRRIEIIR